MVASRLSSSKYVATAILKSSLGILNVFKTFFYLDKEHYQPYSFGNRVATILTILASPEAGGATVWPYAGISIFGQKGSVGISIFKK